MNPPILTRALGALALATALGFLAPMHVLLGADAPPADDSNPQEQSPPPPDSAPPPEAVERAPEAEELPTPPPNPEPDNLAPDRAAPADTASETPASQSTPRVLTPAGSSTRPASINASGIDAPANGAESPATEPSGPANLRLNFRAAPLDLVLNYLSEAAGFIIVLETEVKGKVDVWSNQPVTKNEAVELLNTVLNKNGYAALRNGRTLTIVSRDEAKKRDIPVKSGNNPSDIPKSEEIVTQIIPVRFISAVPLAKDLQALLPSQAALSANEGGNALVLTDTQTNIRRMAEIVRALDTAISSVSSVRVFSLTNADSKALATVITQLFQPQQDNNRNTQGAAGRFFQLMRGGGPGGSSQSTDLTGGRAPTTRVIAVADERSNSVVVSAPEEQMSIVEDVILRMDRDVADVTELRVFRLRYADPQEMSDLLADLFPDTTTSSSTGGNRGQIQFGGRGGFGGNRQSAAGDQSTRLQKQNRVITAPDLRTGSVVVSASRELMPQIASMIEVLDSDPARKQKVHVFQVENTDPQAVGEIIENLFPNQNSRSSTMNRNSTRQTGNQLNNRSTSTQNQGTRSTSNFGSSGLGSSGTGNTGR